MDNSIESILERTSPADIAESNEEFQGRSRNSLMTGRARFALAIAPLALILAACTPDVPGVGGNNPINVDPARNPALATAAAEVEKRETAVVADVTATAKAKAEKSTPPPTSTSTPEAKKIIQCNLLPDKFCDLGEPITRPGRGGQITAVRYILPENTDISALFAADVAVVKKDGEGNPNVILAPIDKTIPTLYIKGDLVDIINDDKGEGVKEGGKLAKTGATGKIYVSWSINTGNGKTVSPQEMINLFERFFGKQVMQKPIIEVPLASAGGGFNMADPKYTSKP